MKRFVENVFHLKNVCSSFISSWIEEIMDILPKPKSLKTFIENLRCARQFSPVLNVIPAMSDEENFSLFCCTLLSKPPTAANHY